KPANVIYVYDGSFPGFLCCVHESVYAAELPFDILPDTEDAPLTLVDIKHITTDNEKAERVHASIPAKISKRAAELTRTVFLSCLKQKELCLLEFLLRAYRESGAMINNFGDATMSPLLKAEKHLLGEAHLLKGLVRFADVGGGLVATITPKNYVLPFIARHFTSRFRDEDFMIFDKTHHAALVHQRSPRRIGDALGQGNGKGEIIRIDSVEFPEVSEQEIKYQTLWKQFYDTVAIESRENPRCRMTHMPKRYWENMLEVKDLL
ncbi:MAG: TIGR03915 family putative DNA repair protein, partial [Oscillospiraceae bacterium]|nr:TIGR03915 family putative DNA repair protein [Oscillospiraceae bacterium]